MLVVDNSTEEINKALLSLSQQLTSINASLEVIKKAIKDMENK